MLYVDMCYICRGIIPGYEHFGRSPQETDKCPLYSDTVKLNDAQIKTAATHALTQYVEDNPEAAAARMDVMKLPVTGAATRKAPARAAAPARVAVAPVAVAVAPVAVAPVRVAVALAPRRATKRAKRR
jgi:hypothetical protein